MIRWTYCTVSVDIFMSQNASTGVRTRHEDIRYHFIRENVEDGIIKIEFVKSNDNDSDIFTKNVYQDDM